MNGKVKAQYWLFLTVFAGIVFNFIMPPLFLKTNYGFSGAYVFTSFIVYFILLILFTPVPIGIFSPCRTIEKSSTQSNREKCFVEINTKIVYVDIYIIILFALAGYLIGLDLYKRGIWIKSDFISYALWSLSTGLGVGLLTANGFSYLVMDFFKGLAIYKKPGYVSKSIKFMVLYMTILSVFNSITYMTLVSYNQLYKRIESEKIAVLKKMDKIQRLPVEDAITEIGFLKDDIEQIFSEGWKLSYAYLFPVVLLIVVSLNPIVFALELKKSLLNILDGTGKAADGDLRNLIPVTRIDEIGDLLSAFNYMMGSLGNMVREIIHIGVTIDVLSEKIRKSISDNSTSIAEISASVQEISASAEQFKRSVEDIHKQIVGLTKKMESAGDTVEQNKALLDGLFNDIDLLTVGIRQIADRVQNLTRKISKIGEVGNVIYKIADDTHLLSINASIEASVAGEYGKRFSIIASEIRKLAENAKEFASEIEKIIKEINEAASETITTTEKSVSDTNKSLKKIGEAKEALDLIFDSVIDGRKIISIIERSAGQQETSVNQLTEALKEVQRAIELIKHSSSELNDSFNDFRAKIESLNAKIKKFKVSDEV